MVSGGIALDLFGFQEQAVIKLIDLSTAPDSKQIIVMKSPTGSGKTVILLDYIDEYLFKINPKTAFVWFCPGSGDLEEQSQDKMKKLLPNRKTQNLFEAMRNGFDTETTTFINWELVRNKNKNLAIRDGERKNLFDRIADAHRSGTEFILIIDEEHAVVKYKLGEDKEQNKMLLESKGYVFGDELIGQVLHGRFVEIADLTNRQNLSIDNYLTTRQKVDTHRHGIYLLHSVDSIKTAIGIPTAKIKVILERLFRKSTKRRFKLIDLPTLEFYAFVINNAKLLRNEFREITSNVELQKELIRNPKSSEFHIPEQDFFKYDPGVKDEVDYLNNAYKDYTSGFVTSLVRSTSEMLFEQYCETRDDIEWVYKNGDSGQQYFSIVYVDGIQHQWLFYADYTVMTIGSHRFCN